MTTETWIARDKDGDLYLYNEKPEKGEDYWGLLFGSYTNLLENTFKEVKWEDEEPLFLEDATELKRTINTMDENHKQSQKYFKTKISFLEESLEDRKNLTKEQSKTIDELIDKNRNLLNSNNQAHEKNKRLLTRIKQLKTVIRETTARLVGSLEDF